MKRRAFLTACFAVLVCSCAWAPSTVRLVPVVEMRLGFAGGDEIVIEEIVGSIPRLETGGVYLLTGRYSLRSRPSARLALYSLGSDNRYRTRGYKNVVVERGEDHFHFAFAVVGDGDLHLSMYEADDEYGNGPALGDVYFRSPDRPFLFVHE
ncbi:MAG: hypothetical protein ACYS99_17945 [Planctomycetota bacterium]|jgi:hypothetical protein